MEILCRRRKNNPVFVGDAGVGKTALAEGLATRLLGDDVPELLEGAEVFSLDTGALLAGTRFRGDFEERFKAVINALAKRPMPILFIDEIHSTVGAGATTGGTMDLATLIKPILTTGQLRVVGSTTHEEFKHIEKDRALARRLQKITIDEPSIQETVRILQGLRSRYEAHHRVRFTDDALEAAAKLAARHLRDYRLPDSAIDVLDEAGAQVRLRQARRPVAERGAPRSPIIDVALAADRGSGRAHGADPGQAGLVVRSRSAAQRSRKSLGRVVFGQEEAVGTVARAIKRSRAGLGQPDRPGRLLPLHRPDRRRQDRARQAARAAPRQRVHALRHERVHGEARRRPADRRAAGLRRLRAGRAAGRCRPPASLRVLLLDEIEKAHPDIFNILLQVMDHATLTDNNGRKADFRQVVLIMTSNAGSREMSAGASASGIRGVPTARSTTARRRRSSDRNPAIEKVFSPEFRNRLDAIVSFGPLSPGVMETIVEKFILQLEAQLAERRIAITLEARGARMAGGEGLRPGVRRAAARPRDPDRGPRSR